MYMYIIYCTYIRRYNVYRTVKGYICTRVYVGRYPDKIQTTLFPISKRVREGGEIFLRHDYNVVL